MACLTASSRLFGTRSRVPASAGLAAVHEGDGERRRDRLVEIGIVEQDVGDFPPSSSVTRFIVAAPSRMIDLPTATEPVKEIFATSGLRTSLGADDIAAADDDVVKTLRELGLVQHLEPHPRLQRAQLAGLYD